MFILKKVDYANLAKEFPEIIKKAYNKSVHNFEIIEELIEKEKLRYSVAMKEKEMNSFKISPKKKISETKNLFPNSLDQSSLILLNESKDLSLDNGKNSNSLLEAIYK